MLNDWIHEILVNGIMDRVEGLFDTISDRVYWITGYVAQTPTDWNPAVFNMIEGIATSVLRPIAGIMLAIILAIDLIQMITEKNHMIEFEVATLIKWIVKAYIGIFLIDNTFGILLAAFELAQDAISGMGAIALQPLVNPATLSGLEESLEGMEILTLIGLFLQLFLVEFLSWIMEIVIIVVIIGRFFEIFIAMSVGPLPLVTMINRDWSSMGQNYLKTMIALAFQGFLIVICVSIYSALVGDFITEIESHDSVMGSLWMVLAFTVLLIFSIFKTGAVSKSIFGAH